MRQFMSSSAIALAIALSSAAQAQQADAPSPPIAPSSGATAYQAAFFAQYAPRNALDIARQVPGFALDLGSSGTRGFAGAAGNVVINGSRPSSKSESLDVVLAAIPANRVARVEIGPGARFGADYAGKSQVLNVILSRASGITGNVTALLRRRYTGEIVPNLSASTLIRTGASTFNLSLNAGHDVEINDGDDRLFDHASGDLFEFRHKQNHSEFYDPNFSASWALEEASDKAIRLNASYHYDRSRFEQDNHVVPTGGGERNDDQLTKFKFPRFEVGGDITRPLAGGAIKLVGLVNRQKTDIRDQVRQGIDGPLLGGFAQNQNARTGETIARVNWTRADLAGFSFEVGIEGALNTLDQKVELFEIEPGGALTKIDLPIDEAKIREKRAEAYIRSGRQLSPSIRLDGGLAYEFSDLSVRGDAAADRTLKFLKPNLSADWKGPDNWHAQLSVRRTVAQLDFGDFLSSANLGSSQVDGGNAELVPQRAWELRAIVEHPIFGDGLIKLEVGHDRISKLQDRILTSDGFDAPGNIGTGKRSFAEVAVDLPLTRFGLKGARLKFGGYVQQTSVKDPIDGRKRHFSASNSNGFNDWHWEVDYRHDIGKFSYGFNFFENESATAFRTDEFDTNDLPPVGGAFVEYRPTARTTVNIEVYNLFDVALYRHRIRFDPNRTNPTPSIDEFRDRNGHVTPTLTIKQAFGTGG